MNHTLVLVMAFSIAVPAATALIRYRKAHAIYFPFLLCMVIGLVNEIISYIFIDIFRAGNIVNSNIYYLAEGLLYTRLFYNFNLFNNRCTYILLSCFICVTWLTDILLISKMIQFTSYFTIVYSLSIVFMSISSINRLLVTQVSLVNPIFAICCCFILYFSVFALVEIFWLYGLRSSRSFRLNVYRITAYINLTVNLIFALSILWMHKKQEFTPQPL